VNAVYLSAPYYWGAYVCFIGIFKIDAMNLINKKTSINIVIIGLGYHAKRIYLDFYLQHENVNLVGVVDLYSKKDNVEKILNDKNIVTKTLFLKNDSVSDFLKTDNHVLLNSFIKDCDCSAVIISTEPLAHFKYVIWALKNKLHILLDKPITTEIDVSINLTKAKKLYTDYLKIEKKYKKVLKDKNLIFILQAQRRFHKGFIYAKEKIKEIEDKTNCPVTSIHSFHSDGQWRLPKEIINLDYHSFNQNYGKMSHSGYHSLDISLWLCNNIKDPSKKFSSFEVYSKFNRPSDFLNQIQPKDYKFYFKNYKSNIDSDYLKNKKIEGEIDAFNSISLYNKKGALITHLTCDVVHNGFSQRGWLLPNLKDLYKGNGRVRQESYIIEQGPFQSIVINSLQSKEILKEEKKNGIGGEDHFDVYIFRNSNLFKECKSYELFQIIDKNIFKGDNYSRGHNENARRNCISEFIQSIKENKKPENQVSNFFEHKMSTMVLSSIYESGAKDFMGLNNKIIKNI